MDEERTHNRDIIKQINIGELSKVKKYLTKHPLADTMEVCLNTGVSPAAIHKFVEYKLLKLRTDLPDEK